MPPTPPPPVSDSADGSLTTSRWRPPTLRLRIDDLAHPGVLIFFEAVPDPTALLRSAVAQSMEWLYTPESAPSVVEDLLLILTPLLGGIASTTGTRTHKEVRMSLSHIVNTGRHGAAHEIEGVLAHEVVHCFQNDAGGTAPGGLIVGIADYVRLRARLAPPHWPHPSASALAKTRWDVGFETTAYFLRWMDDTFGAVRPLNMALADEPFDVARVFEGVTGVRVDELWAAYVDAVEAGWGGVSEGQSDEEGSHEEENQREEGCDDNEDDGWPIPRLDVRIEDVTHAGADIFLASVRPKEVLRSAVRASFARLYTRRNAPRNVKTVTLILRPMPGVAHTCGTRAHKEIHFSLNYIAGVAVSRAAEEITGVLTHEAVHCFQHNSSGTAPGGLIEGIADYVRLYEGLAPPHWKRAVHPNERWDAGYSTTAYFLAWLDKRAGAVEPNVAGANATVNASLLVHATGPNLQATTTPAPTAAVTGNPTNTRIDHKHTHRPFTARLNERLHNTHGAYESRVFVELSGTPIETLWSDYCAAMTSEAEAAKAEHRNGAETPAGTGTATH